MPKLRKSQSAAIGFGPVLKVAILCFLIAGPAVGYVWEKGQIYQLGRQMFQYESRVKQLSNDNQRLADQLAILQSPMMLGKRARNLKLGLVPTQPGQVYRLPEPAITTATGATIAMRPH